MFIQLVRFATYDARGGPEQKEMGGDNYWETPTTQGQYVIGKIEPHISHHKYAWSQIPWGAPLRYNHGILETRMYGGWIPVIKVSPEWGAYTNEQIIYLIKDQNRIMCTPDGKTPDNRFFYVPDKWIFNDFGHISIKYYIDKNGNRRRDKGEALMGDFIHTTPNDEVTTLKAQRSHKKIPAFNLVDSHGCIHVKPVDIDSMISKGYLAIGNVVEVHSYAEKIIPQTINIKKKISLYEAHFFPGLRKLVIYKAPLR